MILAHHTTIDDTSCWIVLVKICCNSLNTDPGEEEKEREGDTMKEEVRKA
jgi:hypothetical protein